MMTMHCQHCNSMVMTALHGPTEAEAAPLLHAVLRTFPALVLHQNQNQKEESDTIAAEKQYSYNCTI